MWGNSQTKNNVRVRADKILLVLIKFSPNCALSKYYTNSNVIIKLKATPATPDTPAITGPRDPGCPWLSSPAERKLDLPQLRMRAA